jgi:sugar phosphate isomerase/epimerase
MKIGTTTFAFRYLFLDPARAPSLQSVVEQARGYGLEVMQVCENARPIELSDREWQDVLGCAGRAGIEIQLGCKTTDVTVFQSFLERAAVLPSRLLRLVFEVEGAQPQAPYELSEFLKDVWPLIQETGVRLAIENHFDVPSRVLAEAVAPYPPAQVGFCVDTANSLRNFESTQSVFDLLGSRAFCYHVKDFRVDGDQLGFRVAGAPLGEGQLDLEGVLERILTGGRAGEVFIENWVPATGCWETDVREDEVWTRRGLGVLLDRLLARGIAR